MHNFRCTDLFIFSRQKSFWQGRALNASHLYWTGKSYDWPLSQGKLRAGKWNGLTEPCQQMPEWKCMSYVLESQRKGIWMSPVGILTAWDNGTLILVSGSSDVDESFCCFKNDCRRFALSTKGACILLLKQSNPQWVDRKRERKHFDIKILPQACAKQGF